MGNSVTMEEMHELLQEELWESEGEILTTLGKVEPCGDADDVLASLVTFVVKKGEHPHIAYGQVREKNAYSGKVLVLEIDEEETHELLFNHPCLAMPSDLSIE